MFHFFKIKGEQMMKKIITDLLRKELGFSGIIITDDMEMGAIANHNDFRTVGVKAVKAGVDIDIEPNKGQSETWQMWIHDPDGNKFEIMQYTDKSLQFKGNIEEDKEKYGKER